MSVTVRIILLICLIAAVYRGINDYKKGKLYDAAPQYLSVVRQNKEGTEQLDLSKKKFLALYHGASWCPPCQAFSPVLSEFYHSAKKTDFELVMVNYDNSAEAMNQYMRQHRMEFPAVQKRNAGAWGKAPSGTGIPNLVIIDMQTRKVIEESYKGGKYQGPYIPLDVLKEKIQFKTQ